METRTFSDGIKRLLEEHPEPAGELAERALHINDDTKWLELLCVLHARGSREVLDVAVRYSQSKVAAERALAAAILGQLGWEERPFLEERLRILVGLLKDKRANVLEAAGIALGHLRTQAAYRDADEGTNYFQDPRITEALTALRNHWSGKVRYGVAFGLQGYEDDEAIQTLIELSEDEQDIVRDWATTGLAGIDRDTPEIREALARRLDDPDTITAQEAREGLARRGDGRVLST